MNGKVVDIDLERAYNNEPEGRVCAFCGKNNDFADDCGYFYLFGDSPCCNSCWLGAPGKAHIAKFGLGDR